MIAIVNGRVHTPDVVLDGGVLLIEDGVISAVGQLDVPAHARIIDAQGMHVVPGFIDVHIHGLLGHDVMGLKLVDAIPLTWSEFEDFQRAARGHIRMLTFAPEETGDGPAIIARLSEAGVIPVIGHSDATFAQVTQYVTAGLAHATHTFNAMRGFHHREPGVLGAVLYYDQIVAQLIADGHHVHPAAMALLLRIKGADRVCLISDAAPLAGLPPGEYEWGSATVVVDDGVCRFPNGTLASAAALLDTGVRTLVNQVGLSLREALVPATRVPADVLCIRKGRLRPGWDADVVLLDEKLQVQLTLVGGQVRYAGDPFAEVL